MWFVKRQVVKEHRGWWGWTLTSSFVLRKFGPFYAGFRKYDKFTYYSLKTWKLITLPNLVYSPWSCTRFVPVYLSSTCTCTRLPCFHHCSSNTFFQSNNITPKLRNKSFACKLLALGFFSSLRLGGQQCFFFNQNPILQIVYVGFQSSHPCWEHIVDLEALTSSSSSHHLYVSCSWDYMSIYTVFYCTEKEEGKSWSCHSKQRYFVVLVPFGSFLVQQHA